MSNTTHRPDSVLLRMATVGAVATALAGALALLLAGTQGIGWQLAARWTAWASCGFFLLVFLEPWVRRATGAPPLRALGLAFVAAHVVHFFTLAIYVQLSRQVPALSAMVIGAVAYVLIVIAPFLQLQAWPRLFTAGLWYVWLVFALTFAERLTMPGRETTGLVGVAVLLLAALLRLAHGRVGGSARSAR